MDDSVVLAAPLFAGLDPEEARPLLATMATVRLTRGDVLFNEGERGDRLFIGLVSAAYVNLAFLGISGKLVVWLGLEAEPSVWISFVLSMIVLGLIMRKG